ncbi:hypothetical protein OBBRIDRAFT_31127 [Obba rivulosa]|uniref:Uncharacterized protein n=1 Tax=Obba rivulosa TaxID=1052685 RepID=A0A8E2AW83_9APHY|nr:hypothetical protein OBBRIDRAFT_31127 [Obba rivulosa]
MRRRPLVAPPGPAAQALYHQTRLGYLRRSAGSIGSLSTEVAPPSTSTPSSLHTSPAIKLSPPRPDATSTRQAVSADAVFDYRDPEVVQKITAETDDAQKAGSETISLNLSPRSCMHRSWGPRVGRLHSYSKSAPEARIRDDVEVGYTLIYISLGRAIDLHYPRSLKWQDEAGPDQDMEGQPHDNPGRAAVYAPGHHQRAEDRISRIEWWRGGLTAIPDELQCLREPTSAWRR